MPDQEYSVTPPPLADRFPAWLNRVAALAPTLQLTEPNGPLAPLSLRLEAPDAEGVRTSLVAYYRERIAAGQVDTPGRLDAAGVCLLGGVS